jgi:glycosyltransferase involved in cell wall biosynthesis
VGEVNEQRAEAQEPIGPDAPRVREVARSVEHLHGPEEVPYDLDELVVLCLVRDGRPYVKSFMDHHLALGVRHVVFLDNGSEDGTVEALKEYDQATVLRTPLPYREYKYALKQYLIYRFGRERWCLYLDVDELFDYPRSDVLDLRSMLGYLNEKRYTVVVAQMLDMFPEGPLQAGEAAREASLKEVHRFYDISDLSRTWYEHATRITGNTVSNQEIRIHHGGIRKTHFDIGANLTKHPLIFVDDRIRPMDGSSHRTNNARVADFSCVLYHYKFLENFREVTDRAVREGNYYGGSFEYRRYQEVLDASPELRMKLATARELRSVNELVASGFLAASEDYNRRADAEEERRVFPLLREDPEKLWEAFHRLKTEKRLTEQKARRLNRELYEQRLRLDQLREWAEKQREQAQKIPKLSKEIHRLSQQAQNTRLSNRVPLLRKGLHFLSRTKKRILGGT